MSSARSDTLPVIDCGGLAGAGEAALAARLDQVFREIGFCYLRNIGVEQALVEGVFAASRAFHALPAAEKRALAMNGAHRGYMEPNSSLIVTSSVARVKRPNFSESLMVMHEVEPDDPRYGTEVHGANQWPELPGFRAAVEAYEAAMRRACTALLRPMAIALGLAPDWFAPHFARPTTFLRLLHYPPQPADSPEDAFGSAPHTDYGFLTVLAQDDAGGLEVRRADGTWLAAPPIPGTWVVNVADMLSRWTNRRWQSTPHRVRNLSGGDRYSCPYFFDMDTECVVECLPGTGREEPVRYGDYLMERLDRNYSYRRQG